MEEILKICSIAIIATVLISLIRIYKPELTVYMVTAASVIIIVCMISQIKVGFIALKYIYEELSYGKSYFPIIIKILGIAYITEFTSSICTDCGEKAIAAKVELAGKISILLAALPIFTSLLELLKSTL